MASSPAAMKMSLFLLLTLSLSLHITHARESQFFNKIPSTTTTTNNNKEVIPTNQQEPNFLPENENSYGLYGHESGQNPPSTAAAATTTTTTSAATEFKQPLNKYLPKNYNPVAYVTQPEDFSEGNNAAAFPEETSYTNNPNNINNNENANRNNYYSGAQNYYNNNQQQEEETEFRRYPTAARDNFNYNGGSSFNSQPQPQGGNTFQPQGMSDTRYMENGKYFYDINSEKYSANHPYESLRGARAQNQLTNRNFYANNAYEFNADNSIGGYQREDFQDEDNNMP